MSDHVRDLVWRYYVPAHFGAPMIMAIALSDEADDRGGGISESALNLAIKTRQTDRAVRSQLKALEDSGLLECVFRSVGGPGQFNVYRLHLRHLLPAANPDPNSGLTLNVDQGYGASNPDPQAGLDSRVIANHIRSTTSTKVHVAGASRIRVAENPDDAKLAHWMFEKIKTLNPKHQTPNFTSWCETIRLMMHRDGRSRNEIAGLFDWANKHRFWHKNILSPRKLREQWDRLVIERRSEGGAAPPDPLDDGLCSRVFADGSRCQNRWTTCEGGKPAYCSSCVREVEREQLGPKAPPLQSSHA
mgnify:CR=1 FL=1